MTLGRCAFSPVWPLACVHLSLQMSCGRTCQALLCCITSWAAGRACGQHTAKHCRHSYPGLGEAWCYVTLGQIKCGAEVLDVWWSVSRLCSLPAAVAEAVCHLPYQGCLLYWCLTAAGHGPVYWSHLSMCLSAMPPTTLSVLTSTRPSP